MVKVQEHKISGKKSVFYVYIPAHVAHKMELEKGLIIDFIPDPDNKPWFLFEVRPVQWKPKSKEAKRKYSTPKKALSPLIKSLVKSLKLKK